MSFGRLMLFEMTDCEQVLSPESVWVTGQGAAERANAPLPVAPAVSFLSGEEVIDCSGLASGDSLGESALGEGGLCLTGLLEVAGTPEVIRLGRSDDAGNPIENLDCLPGLIARVFTRDRPCDRLGQDQGQLVVAGGNELDFGVAEIARGERSPIAPSASGFHCSRPRRAAERVARRSASGSSPVYSD